MKIGKVVTTFCLLAATTVGTLFGQGITFEVENRDGPGNNKKYIITRTDTLENGSIIKETARINVQGIIERLTRTANDTPLAYSASERTHQSRRFYRLYDQAIKDKKFLQKNPE